MDPPSFDDLKTMAKTLVIQLLKGDYSTAISQFDQQMKNTLTETMLRESWETLISDAGDLLQLTIIRTAEMEGYRIVFIRCQFEMNAINVQVVFNSQGSIGGLNFSPLEVKYNPPAYVDESAFHELEVTIGSGKWALPGTLTIPEGSGPFDGVVLVHGSGPNDRDETVGANKVFRDISWGLASQGIAVLRYEKRTKEHAKKFTPEIIAHLTVKEEVIDDTIKAVQLMRTREEINSKHIILLGHSLGATMAPRIGQQDTELAGLIIMAGITRPLEDVILDQFTYIYSLSGALSDEQKAELETLKEKVARVKDPELSDKISPQELPLGVSPAYWLDLRDYRPAEVAKTLPIPMLILQGGRDYQVLATKDFEGWKKVLKSREDVSLKLYPQLNHLFIEGEGKSTPQEYGIEGHVNPDVIDTIVSWIKSKSLE
jgi:dienelactone hydrolase